MNNIYLWVLFFSVPSSSFASRQTVLNMSVFVLFFVLFFLTCGSPYAIKSQLAKPSTVGSVGENESAE